MAAVLAAAAGTFGVDSSAGATNAEQVPDSAGQRLAVSRSSVSAARDEPDSAAAIVAQASNPTALPTDPSEHGASGNAHTARSSRPGCTGGLFRGFGRFHGGG
jgi:hypothetical protein